MAMLNYVEGKAYVRVDDNDRNWWGYILVASVSSNRRYFHVEPLSAARVDYAGPILFQGNYYLGYGVVCIMNVQDTPQGLRVEFEGVKQFEIVETLKGQPPDFLAEE